MKQVLYITYDGLTDPLGQSQILPYIIGLSKRGYQYTIISCEKPERFSSGKELIQSICKENGINWHPLMYHKKPPVLSTVKDVFNIKKTAYRLHQQYKFDIVHCRSYISALVGLSLKRKMGLKFVFDMRGFWPEERVDGGLWNLSNPLYKLVFNYFKSKEAAFVQHSDAIVSLTEAGKKIILGWPNMQYSNKITVIPCSVDMQLFSRESLDPVELNRIKTNLQSPMVVGYYGSLGTWYMLEEMLDQFKAIQTKIPQAKFLMVSNDPWIEDYDLLLAKKQIDKSYIYFTNSPRKLMPYYIANTHIALFFIKACYSKISSSPTKHGEIMSLGIPLITNSGVGDIDAIVQATQSGYILQSFDETSYQVASSSIDQLLLLDPSTIRNACKKYYSLESALDKYENIYKLLN